MSNATKLVAEARESFGKGVARKLRAVGKTPVVLYGHGIEPKHLTIETHPLSLVVRHANALVELDIAGETQLALVKDVQKDPVRQVIEHVDLLVVSKREKVEASIPVVVEGEPFSGTIALQEAASLLVTVPAVAIPEHIVVDVEGLTEGTQILAKDLKLDADVELAGDPEELVVHVAIPEMDAEMEAEEAAAEAAE
ncbi:50S ribosomal protein L25/general stress protein Ctc [Leucobacter sp. OH2974_COT-288]|uniref:Large ribosomal subunit protein bL25 n=1 Tax=Canibacter oris TaxID=1365628 RepID=A0A840DQ92_9MICO|nr:50S ribosomal protein L25/general stress protein Ctc [Canibacter oris]MBB4071366.1 large subunit ribosomal protein L25 [Canibacter oris]RRD35272.1 50S ribosomal protein L25/general stress protein Ctc [Leucobacter sp. OH2974_COT-288]